MNRLVLNNVAQAGDKIIYAFAPCPPEQLAHAAGYMMQQQGYRIEQGNPMNAVYGIGNSAMRILFGAFVKRYTFHVCITPGINGEVQLELSKAMTGFSGGVIGMAKLNTEFNRVQQLLRMLQ